MNVISLSSDKIQVNAWKGKIMHDDESYWKILFNDIERYWTLSPFPGYDNESYWTIMKKNVQKNNFSTSEVVVQSNLTSTTTFTSTFTSSLLNETVVITNLARGKDIDTILLLVCFWNIKVCLKRCIANQRT